MHRTGPKSNMAPTVGKVYTLRIPDPVGAVCIERKPEALCVVCESSVHTQCVSQYGSGMNSKEPRHKATRSVHVVYCNGRGSNISRSIGNSVLYGPGVNVSRNVGARHIDQQNKYRASSVNVLHTSERLFSFQATERLL